MFWWKCPITGTLSARISSAGILIICRKWGFDVLLSYDLLIVSCKLDNLVLSATTVSNIDYASVQVSLTISVKFSTKSITITAWGNPISLQSLCRFVFFCFGNWNHPYFRYKMNDTGCRISNTVKSTRNGFLIGSDSSLAGLLLGVTLKGD